MAHSKKSAGNGAASGSAAHHVPASPLASPEAVSAVGAPAARPDRLPIDLDGIAMLLDTIRHLASSVVVDGGADAQSVVYMAEAIEACAEKASAALELVLEAPEEEARHG